jgi:hypothetical protein
LREKGVARASRSLKKSKREPSGVSVKPGNYQLKMTFGKEVAEQTINVAYDPRLEMSELAINQKYDAGKVLESYQDKITNIVRQLVTSKNTATTIKAQLTKEDASASDTLKKYKAEIKASTIIIKKIDTLISKYLGTIDKRQGITRNPEITVTQRFGVASSYIRSRFGEQTTTEKVLMNQFKAEFKKVVSETNAFFAKDWTAYKAATENIIISPFKETKIYITD